MTDYLGWLKNGVAVSVFAGFAQASMAAEQTITTDPVNTDVKAGEAASCLISVIPRRTTSRPLGWA